MNNITVDILLATFNGESFIAAQLDSLLIQSHKDIHIIIRDDLSTDQTRKILEDYASRFSFVITLLTSEKRLGVKGNFSRLMENSHASYIMFADQDDLWDISKVEKTLSFMNVLEKGLSKDLPLLVYTDVRVVDKDLNILSPSFWDYSGIDHKYAHTLNRLLMQNVVTGCSMMINRPLLLQALPIPESCAMHDWWMALAAASLGKIEALAEPTMLYRQHGRNTLGAQKFLSWNYIKQGFRKLREPETAKQAQAQELLARYQGRLNANQIKMLKDYQQMSKSNLFEKIFLIFKHGFFKIGLLRNVVNILFKKF